MKNRITALALFAALGTMFISCGGSGSTSETTTAPSGETTAAPVEESPFESDDLPALDFEGETINVLYREDVVNSFYVAEQSGDIVDDAVHDANLAVQTRLNVNVEPILLAGTANADRTTYMAAITNSVLAGDEAYDLCGVLTYNIPTLIQQGVLSDLLELKHLSFDKPWWTASLTELATVGGKLYFASGDITLEMTQRLFCMLFNKELAETLAVGDIYGLINDGAWTLDKMKELGAAAYADLNGNSTVDHEDRYGVVINDYNHMSNFMAALDVNYTQLDATDNRQHLKGDTEHIINAMQKLVNVFNNNDGIFYMSKSDADPATVADNHDVYRAMFKDDRLLFVTTEFHQISSVYRDMESEYGVIPYPKYDEEQEGYYSLARNVYSSFVVPKTCSKLDAVGAFMEATASQNYRDVSPVYFETALKVKYSRDDETSQMYDLIKAGMKFNFAFTYSAVANDLANTFNGMVSSNDENWASKYASISDATETKLEKFYDDVEALD